MFFDDDDDDDDDERSLALCQPLGLFISCSFVEFIFERLCNRNVDTCFLT